MCERAHTRACLYSPACVGDCLAVPPVGKDVSALGDHHEGPRGLTGCAVTGPARLALAVTVARRSPDLCVTPPPHTHTLLLPGPWHQLRTPGPPLARCGTFCPQHYYTDCPSRLCTEKKCCREMYIGDMLELDPGPASSGGSGGSDRHPSCLSLLSADSHSSAHGPGLEPGEMSVDASPGAQALRGNVASCSPSPSPSRGSGDSGGSRVRPPQGDTQDPRNGECSHRPQLCHQRGNRCHPERGRRPWSRFLPRQPGPGLRDRGSVGGRWWVGPP